MQKARDLYDLHMMFQNGVGFSEVLVNEKLEYYKLKFTKQPFIDRCEQLRSGWKMELESLMMNVPPYEDALDSVNEMISRL
ncbi:MAG: nucleotidyl transferase AbiEii/AbiGii toxin family protein [Thermoplasmata archaeon]|nr:nucleotidyl transferase AbiEii/AbiGii toxin family protein [Thermoplasmata archaeon]